MDGYGPACVAHNVPYLVISGLGQHLKEVIRKDGGARIASEIPVVESDDAATLLKHFRESDATNLPWNGREHSARNRFKIKIVGRDYVLPPRHAQPLAAVSASPTSRPVLHSALSPLSPGSSVFPDGLIDFKWVEKHQDRVPSAYVSFYTFTCDSKLSTLHDNQLKTDINHTKSVLQESGYKTRLTVALLSEKSIVQSPDVEDRLANIRKATGLDSKTSLFFLPPQSSQVELKAFVETILTTTYPLAIEYYRDLSKHARRKRNRGVVPPPSAPPTSGTSQTLSSQGWNVRYDFKLGVFAEFRQEMDSAIRSYESGYEALLGPDVLEMIANWSPRWNEGRLLADVFAIRILRCLLWNVNTTAAVRRWQLHREKIRDFVDRRGKGSSTYGWEAWEARWATVMAEMITKVSIPEFNGSTIWLPVEKNIATGERIQPWEYLHHPGYWFRAASEHLLARRALAMAIPEEDRSPPGSSPASQNPNKSYTYDTYLCPAPHEENPLPGITGVDHTKLLVSCLTSAITEFEMRKQHRLVQELQMLLANENMNSGAWEDALQILRPMWHKMTFRKEGWWNAIEEVSWALRKTAVIIGDGGSILAVDWELMNKNFTHQSNWRYDITKSLEGLDTIKGKPAVVLNNRNICSFLSASYSFEHAEGKVGEPCYSQFAVTSSAIPSSVSITVSEVRIEFEGSMKPIILKHNGSEASATHVQDVILRKITLQESIEGSRPILTGESNLSFSPNDTRIFEFKSLPREAGNAQAVSATFIMAEDLFDLEYVHNFGTTSMPDVWWNDASMKKRHVRTNGSTINILPKPPKVELKFVDRRELYYTNEYITVQVSVVNGEEVDAIINIEAHLHGEGAPTIQMKFSGSSPEAESIASRDKSEGIKVGELARDASTTIQLLIPPIMLPSTYDLSLKTSYHLVSDLDTPIYRIVSIPLEVINPFEANYDFSPRVHPDPWPSIFAHDEGSNGESEETTARGLAQKWCLTARYASFAADELIVEDAYIEILGSNGGVLCSTQKITKLPEGGLHVAPKSLDEAQFDVLTQKLSLDDRGTATIDVSLGIKWRRDSQESPVNTTILGVPRLLVSSSEPRVLAAVSYSTTVASMIHFDVTIENPSNHFLTFGVTMEPSEKFAFSGVKQSTLQLVPLSRRTMRFRLLPGILGEWIGPIHCVIRDKYFQKVLKIAPTEGMRLDKEGLMIWVPLLDDESEEVGTA